MPNFAWNVLLIAPIFLKRSLIFPLFPSISLHWSLKKAFTVSRDTAVCLCSWGTGVHKSCTQAPPCGDHSGHSFMLSVLTPQVSLWCHSCSARRRKCSFCAFSTVTKAWPEAGLTVFLDTQSPREPPSEFGRRPPYTQTISVSATRVLFSSWIYRPASMLLNCGAGEYSWESLGLQGDPTRPS